MSNEEKKGLGECLTEQNNTLPTGWVAATCGFGHKFAKLPDHPRNSLEHARCPYCMVEGLKRARAKADKQLTAILSFIDEGADELLIRRIWERALRAS